MVYDVDNNEYTEEEAIKVIPKGIYCYKTTREPCKENGYKLETKLCPFLDWLKRSDIKNFYDFQNTGYCHFLQLGDWFDKKSGKEEEIIHLERFKKETVKVNSKQEGTDLLWDSCKECGINDDLDEMETLEHVE